MHYQALLFCPDDKTARVVTQVLSELEFQVECSNEPFAAVKKLMAQHFDAMVVDCDNEQNATLLFKSARNSGSNSSALSVGVVEGQTGVAKAFRIGANLVLTKPINVEQSKSTLRVARGLLRKAEAHKPVAAIAIPSPQVSESPAMPQVSPTILVAPPEVPAPMASGSAFELAAEPDVKPDVAEATLLEYMPKIPAAPAASTRSSDAKELSWQAVPTSVPMPAGGTAAAAAPAKEVADPEIVPFEAKAAPAPARPEPPMFSSLSAPETRGQSSNGASAKKFVFILIAAVLVIAGYFGWTKMHVASNPVAVQEPSVPFRPTAVVTPPAPATPEQQAATTTPAQPVTDIPAQQPEEISLEPDAKPAPAKPTPVVVKTAPTGKEATPAKTTPITVKNDFSAPKSEAAMLPPVPPSIPSAPDSNMVASIVNSPIRVPNPVRETQTLKVSQGVSQGMLIKRVQPVYPGQAKQMHLEGAVQLIASIAKDGSISSVKQLSGDAILGRAAVDAVRQWKYKPYFLNGEPVEIQTQITVNFKLP